MKCHVKKGDEVVVLAGKEKGKRGKIIAVSPKKQRVIVEGLQLIKRHTRKSQGAPEWRDCRARGDDPPLKCHESGAGGGSGGQLNNFVTAKSVTLKNESQTLRKIQKRSGARAEAKAQLHEHSPDSEAGEDRGEYGRQRVAGEKRD